MNKIATAIFVIALGISGSSAAFAQAAGGAAGAGGSVGSSVGSAPTSGTSSFSQGAGTTPSTTTGLGNGNNPGYGDRSDPSVRANPGLDANGPCNGARSTSGNNTPSC